MSSDAAVEAAREKRRSRRQEAQTPILLLKSAVCLLHLIGEKVGNFTTEKNKKKDLVSSRKLSCSSVSEASLVEREKERIY